MTRTSSRLSAALVLIALLGLSLPVSALDQPRRVPEVLSWLQEWMDTLWSVLAPDTPDAPQLSHMPAVEMDNGAGGGDRGALIDPNGNPGGR